MNKKKVKRNESKLKVVNENLKRGMGIANACEKADFSIGKFFNHKKKAGLIKVCEYVPCVKWFKINDFNPSGEKDDITEDLKKAIDCRKYNFITSNSSEAPGIILNDKERVELIKHGCEENSRFFSSKSEGYIFSTINEEGGRLYINYYKSIDNSPIDLSGEILDISFGYSILENGLLPKKEDAKYKFSNFSLGNLQHVHKDLREILDEAIKIMDFRVTEGFRNEKRQNQLKEEGKSKLSWPKSKHNRKPSLAVDVVPYPIDWNDSKRFILLAGIIKGIAQQKGIPIRWGGDWNGDSSFNESFIDMPHFELC